MMRFKVVSAVLLGASVACTANQPPGGSAPATKPPPDAAGATARLTASPRHGEWVMIRTGPTDIFAAGSFYRSGAPKRLSSS